MPPPRIYLAGPEVFLPDALAVGARKVALCAAHGLEGVFPLDAGLDLTGLPKPEAARRISEANEGLMRSCAGLIASGGSVVRTAVPAGEEMRDLAGFRACLAQAVKVLTAWGAIRR